jgi:hypothetical protein
MSNAFGGFVRGSDGKMRPHFVHGHLVAALSELQYNVRWNRDIAAAINMSVIFWYRYYFSKLPAVFTKPKSELKVSATAGYGYAHQPGKLKSRRTVKKAAAAPSST